jgi:molecular chaperone DnaK
MVKESEEHAAEDRAQKELVDVRNQADSVIYSVEKTLKDYGEKISFEERSEIGKKVEELKQKKDGDDVSAIKQAMDDLQQSVYKLSEAVYKEASQAKTEGPGQPPPQEEPKEGPQEAGEQGDTDYRVVDDEADKGN